ncbi:MAG: cyclic nucleotide-binding domain-containing protein [Pseudomonadota bacterium]
MSMHSIEELRKQFKKGDVLLREGEMDSQILLPEEGILDVFIQGRKVNSIDASVAQDFLGEVGAILGVPRTATVVAATDVIAICLPKIELEAVMKDAPSLGVKLIRSLCRKLVNSTTAFAEFQENSFSILQSGSTDISLKNYMKGLLYLIEQTADEDTPEAGKKLLHYFHSTNPWGMLNGDAEQVMDSGGVNAEKTKQEKA